MVAGGVHMLYAGEVNDHNGRTSVFYNVTAGHDGIAQSCWFVSATEARGHEAIRFLPHGHTIQWPRGGVSVRIPGNTSGCSLISQRMLTQWGRSDGGSGSATNNDNLRRSEPSFGNLIL